MSFNLLQHIRENDDYTVIWLFNIGLEKNWNGEVFTVKNTSDDIIVNHMEEMNLLLTRKQDILILRKMPSGDYLKAMETMGASIPTIVCPYAEDEGRSISELVIEDDKLIHDIKMLVSDREKVIFVPYGVSTIEEDIATLLQVDIFGATNDINKIINNKIFSRNFAIAHNFKVPGGRICKGFDELQAVAAEFLGIYGKIIIKEPCGASGKGLWVVETPAKLKSTLLIIKRFFKEHMDSDWLVEQWCTKQADLNYQVYVGLNGDVEVFSIKEQVVNGTVYVGSIIPPTFTEDIIEQCNKCGLIIGKELYNQGYRGILGIDAMIVDDGTLVPIVEINGRFTLSTYISFLNFLTGREFKKIFAFYKKITLSEGDNYKRLSDKVVQAGLEYKYKGVFIYTSETVNSGIIDGFGRMFALVFADDEDEMNDYYNRCIELMSKED